MPAFICNDFHFCWLECRWETAVPIRRHEFFCPHAAIDLKNGGGSLQKGPYGGKVDVTFTVADEDFMEVVQGKLNPQKVRNLHTGRMGRFSCPIPAVKTVKT